MRKCLFVAILVTGFPLAMIAQETPPFSVFGGYTLVRAKSFNQETGFSLNGWDTSLQVKALPSLGIVADLSQQYASPYGESEKQTLALFGPRLIFRGNTQATPYIHLLAGFVHGTKDIAFCIPEVPCSPIITGNAFALDVGGGMDVKLKGRLWWRAFQLDWLHGDLSPDHDNHFRVSTGVVIRFGRLRRTSKP